MSNVSPIQGPQIVPVAPRGAGGPAAASTPSVGRERDHADFSVIARFRSQLASLPEVRQNVIDRVRAEIEAGDYESADKIEAAIDALVEDL